MEDTGFYPKLEDYCATIESEFAEISDQRKEILDELADYVQERQAADERTSVIVICTHNSRRSHMGQIWLLTAAAYYGIDNVVAGSGGTEATAVNGSAVNALEDAGFRVRKLNSGENPPYQVSMSPKLPGIDIFSKKYDHAINPASDFAAVLVCSEADAACPIVPGAGARIALPFEDPKYSDGTPREEQAYAKTCREIAREMFYAMSLVKEQMVREMEMRKR